MTGWQDYVIADDGARALQALPPGVPPTTALGLLGITGMTAYFGLLDVGQDEGGRRRGRLRSGRGDRLDAWDRSPRSRAPSKVIGIAGGREKCSWIVDELGFDAAVDYKGEDVAARLREEAPDGHRRVLRQRRRRDPQHLPRPARDEGTGRRVRRDLRLQRPQRGQRARPTTCNLIRIRGRMEGFLILDYLDRLPAAQAEIAGWLAEGKLKSAEHVVEGLERAPEALNLLFTGGNIGKVIVKV